MRKVVIVLVAGCLLHGTKGWCGTWGLDALGTPSSASTSVTMTVNGITGPVQINAESSLDGYWFTSNNPNNQPWSHVATSGTNNNTLEFLPTTGVAAGGTFAMAYTFSWSLPSSILQAATDGASPSYLLPTGTTIWVGETGVDPSTSTLVPVTTTAPSQTDLTLVGSSSSSALTPPGSLMVNPSQYSWLEYQVTDGTKTFQLNANNTTGTVPLSGMAMVFQLPAGVSLPAASSFPSTPNSSDVYLSAQFSVENGSKTTPGFGNPVIAAAPEPSGAVLLSVTTCLLFGIIRRR